MSSADDDIPGTSLSSSTEEKKTKKSKSGNSKSSPRSGAGAETKNALSSPSPDRANNAFPRRSPATLRDRVLLANANAAERALSVSNGELSDTATSSGSSSTTTSKGRSSTTTSSTSSSSSSSSTPTTGTQYDGDNPDTPKAKTSGPRKAKKKKTKKYRERRQSKDAVLIGWSGSFPNLSSTQSIDSESEKQSSPGDLRAIGASGLGIFPPEREEGQQQSQQQQESSRVSPTVSDPNVTSTTTTITTKSEQQQEAIATTTSDLTAVRTAKIETSTPSPIANSTAEVKAQTPKSAPDPDPTDLAIQEQQQDKERVNKDTLVEEEQAEEGVNRVAVCNEKKRRASSEVKHQSEGEDEIPQDKRGKAKRFKMARVNLGGRSKSSNDPATCQDVSQKFIVKRSRSEGYAALMNIDKLQSPEQQEAELQPRQHQEKQQDQKEKISRTANVCETVNDDKPAVAKQEVDVLMERKLENKQEVEKKPENKQEVEEKKPEIENEQESSSIVRKSDRTPSAQQSRRPPTPKLKPTDEFFRLPFAHGWKRELVLPSTDTHRRSGDVFFISPEGRKFRSREDIIPHLKDNLTIDHFCFQRVSQGVGPEFELVRRAVPVNSRAQPSIFSSTPAVSGKRVPKPKVPKGASPPPEGWTSTMAVKGNARAMASGNGSTNLAHNHGAGGSVSRKRSSQSSTKHMVAKQQPSPPTKPADQGQDSSLDNDADNEADVEDEDNGSGASLAEISEQMEQPGQLPPAQLLSDNNALTPRWQEIVVIGGRKAIAILDNPPRIPRRRCPPVAPQAVMDNWNSKYEKLYNKRIAGPKKLNQNSILESLGNMHNGCQVLLAIMKTMTLKERANMSHVCKCWAMVSRDRSVWRSVSLRDTYISNWIICLRELARHRTRELDMMGMILAKPGLRLTGDLRILKSLRVLRTDPSDADFLHLVFKYLPQLLELRSICTSNALNLVYLESMQGLRVLRLHMTDHKAKLSSMSILASLTHLTELCVRGATNFGKMEIRQLKALTRLETLILGSCLEIDREQLGQEVLPALKNLRHFRLENEHKIMAVFPIDEIMEGIAAAGKVKRLELLNVDVAENFSQLLAKCKTVEELLLMPKCMHNTANMTNAVMQAVSDNAEQLKILRLGFVSQLLSATNNLCKGKDKDVVPVRRPVPGIPANDRLNHCSEDCYETDHDQCVGYLPMERLESILHHMIPQAWLSVAKIAMRDTTKLQFLRRTDAGQQVQSQEIEK